MSSLGSHVAGMTGNLGKGMKKTLGRITALDPAKPCFAKPSIFRLGKKENDWFTSTSILTSAGVLGLEQPVGHADIYINGVSNQPECQDKRIRDEMQRERNRPRLQLQQPHPRVIPAHDGGGRDQGQEDDERNLGIYSPLCIISWFGR